MNWICRYGYVYNFIAINLLQYLFGSQYSVHIYFLGLHSCFYLLKSQYLKQDWQKNSYNSARYLYTTEYFNSEHPSLRIWIPGIR